MGQRASKAEAHHLREKMGNLIKTTIESREGIPRFATMRGAIRTGGPPDKPAMAADAVTKPQTTEKLCVPMMK
jgi:hypothetical protein